MSFYSKIKDFLNNENFFRKDSSSNATIFNVFYITTIRLGLEKVDYYIESKEEKRRISKFVIKARNVLRALWLMFVLALVILKIFNWNDWDNYTKWGKVAFLTILVNHFLWHVWYWVKIDKLIKKLKDLNKTHCTY